MHVPGRKSRGARSLTCMEKTPVTGFAASTSGTAGLGSKGSLRSECPAIFSRSRELNPRTFSNIPDLCSAVGARQLAARIEAYWRERGAACRALAIRVGDGTVPGASGNVYAVRSSLIRGLPADDTGVKIRADEHPLPPLGASGTGSPAPV